MEEHPESQITDSETEDTIVTEATVGNEARRDGTTETDETAEADKAGDATLGDQVSSSGGGPEGMVDVPEEVVRDLAHRADEIKPADIDALDHLTPEQKYEVKTAKSLDPKAANTFEAPPGDPEGTQAVVNAWLDYDPEADSPEAIEERYGRIEQEQAAVDAGYPEGAPSTTPDAAADGGAGGAGAATDGANAGGANAGGEAAGADVYDEASQFASSLIQNRSPQVCAIYAATLSTAIVQSGVLE